jgi:hypothetical protein
VADGPLLQVTNVTRDDAGTYECTAKNSKGKSTKKVKLDVTCEFFFSSNDQHTDYRCEDGGFLVSTSCVIISNPDSLSSSETGVDLGIRS